MVQAGGPADREGDPDVAPHRPAHAAALPQGLQPRDPDRGLRPFGRRPERRGHPGDQRRLGRADVLGRSVLLAGRRGARRTPGRQVSPEPDQRRARQVGPGPDRVRHRRRRRHGRGRRPRDLRANPDRRDPVRSRGGPPDRRRPDHAPAPRQLPETLLAGPRTLSVQPLRRGPPRLGGPDDGGDDSAQQDRLLRRDQGRQEGGGVAGPRDRAREAQAGREGRGRPRQGPDPRDDPRRASASTAASSARSARSPARSASCRAPTDPRSSRAARPRRS